MLLGKLDELKREFGKRLTDNNLRIVYNMERLTE